MAPRSTRGEPNNGVANILRNKRAALSSAVVAGAVLVLPLLAEAEIVRGVEEVVSGVLQVPFSIIAGTFSGPPILGTLFGAVRGLVGGTGLVAHGALELLSSAVSVAKTIGPYVLPFVL